MLQLPVHPHGHYPMADMKQKPLTMLAVYQNPKDYPGKIVVREWLQGTFTFYPGEAKVFDSLEEAREYANGEGRVCLERSPDDDDVLVETWL